MNKRSSTCAVIWKQTPTVQVILGVVTLCLGIIWTPVLATAQATFCTDTANTMLTACRAETEDDFSVAMAQCLNVSDGGARTQCETEADTQREEAQEECDEQLSARLEVCGLVGEERYDPDFTPANFVNPDEIGGAVTPNPYFPLIPGTRWVYQGGEETITVIVTDKTKLIEGVTCRVVNDVVEQDGAIIEDTDDWYAQDLTGNIWYCGEIAKNFETFEGDAPEDAELVDIEGSFKVGRDGAKAGMIMLADPQVGNAYRQEAALGNAEDVAEVISITGNESVPAASCNNTCLVTRDFTPLEPGVNENKHYARGIGAILEVDAEGNRTELIEFTTP
jgi:hypothetical protein